MDRDTLLMFLTVGGSLFGYHKYIVSYIDKKKMETEKELENMMHFVKTRDEDLKEQIKELKQLSNTKDNEIKDLIKELKNDIKDLTSGLKEDIKYLRDRDCKKN